MKKYILLLVSIIVNFNLSFSEHSIIVNFNLENTVTKTSDFKLLILTKKDTIAVFNSLKNNELISSKEILFSNDSVVAIFQYKQSNNQWNNVEYKFDLDTSKLKRVEINLGFSVNKNQIEFLQDFSIEKYYKIETVKIKHYDFEIGDSPTFKLESLSDSTFYGFSSSNFFYGTIKLKTANGWESYSGSYCSLSNDEKPLTKFDNVYSWIPNYNPEDKYQIKQSGTYKYVVAMTLEKFSEKVIPMELVNNAITKKEILNIFEVETTFNVY